VKIHLEEHCSLTSHGVSAYALGCISMASRDSPPLGMADPWLSWSLAAPVRHSRHTDLVPEFDYCNSRGAHARDGMTTFTSRLHSTLILRCRLYHEHRLGWPESPVAEQQAGRKPCLFLRIESKSQAVKETALTMPCGRRFSILQSGRESNPGTGSLSRSTGTSPPPLGNHFGE